MREDKGGKPQRESRARCRVSERGGIVKEMPYHVEKLKIG
jgi:hypothetical protein